MKNITKLLSSLLFIFSVAACNVSKPIDNVPENNDPIEENDNENPRYHPVNVVSYYCSPAIVASSVYVRLSDHM